MGENILATFSERFNELMQENEYTYQSLGDVLDLNHETIRLWAKAKRYITLQPLVKIADLFECSLEYLIGREDDATFYENRVCPSFYPRLIIVMDEKGITKTNIVRDTIIYDSHFTNWKAGSDPHLLSLVLLSDYLDCTIDYLIGRD